MIHKQLFGTTKEGKEIFLFSLVNRLGTIVSIINYGAIITAIVTADKEGVFEDIVLGFDNLADYLENPPYFGAVVGRCANRIAGGNFPLNDRIIELTKNRKGFHLHGGFKGFDKQVWEAHSFEKEKECGLQLSYLSRDGEEGYPGNLKTTVRYTLTKDNRLILEFNAETDKTTIVNLTNHSYFNLKGEGNGTVYNHRLQMMADFYTVLTKETLVPTGEWAPVKNTPYDFRQPKAIGEHIGAIPPGYDINFVLNTKEDENRMAARVEDPQSGRFLELYTNQAGVQFYTGNYLENRVGKKGHVYGNHHAFCLETQAFPDAMHHPDFPSVVLNPGERYNRRTIFRFGVMA